MPYQIRLDNITIYSSRTPFSGILLSLNRSDIHRLEEPEMFLKCTAVRGLQAHETLLHERLEHFSPKDGDHVIQNQLHQLAVDEHGILGGAKDHLVDDIPRSQADIPPASGGRKVRFTDNCIQQQAA